MSGPEPEWPEPADDPDTEPSHEPIPEPGARPVGWIVPMADGSLRYLPEPEVA